MSPQIDVPAGYALRAATPGDFRGVFDLLVACDVEDYGVADYEEVDLRDDWRHVDLAQDTQLAVDAAGAIAGYAAVSTRSAAQFDGTVYVAPAHWGRGIGTALTRWTDARARERVSETPDGARVTIAAGVPTVNERAMRLLENEGYAIDRYFLRMFIELKAPPSPPKLAPGVSIRTFVVGHDERATHDAIEESFRDHWGHVERPFEKFLEYAVGFENFDPSLWFLAVDGEEIAGVSLCSNFVDMGFVNTLGVRRPWRRTGLGLALLHHSFGEFYRRGRPKIGLGVDAQSLTGATRLYERAGMHAQRRYALHRKELRAGVELGTQEIPA